ncbi:type II secretion system protein GspM [Aestuariivirga sp.]|uniref:type II secretion system protein GspM n=1 Tax=Aestuariivirga sp. TaxID=2650926 RepID=UPI003BA8C0BF
MTMGRPAFRQDAMVFAVAGVLAMSLVFWALDTVWSSDARLQELAKLNGRLQQFVQSGGTSVADGSPLDGVPADFFLSDGTAAEISAQLSTLLSGIAAAQGLQVLSTGDAPEDPGTAAPAGRYSAVLEASGTLRAILGVLSAVVQARPKMAIERLEIRSSMPQGPDARQEASLSLSLQVSGFSRPGTSASMASP